jgi:hypothetical protein
MVALRMEIKVGFEKMSARIGDVRTDLRIHVLGTTNKLCSTNALNGSGLPRNKTTGTLGIPRRDPRKRLSRFHCCSMPDALEILSSR